MNEISFSYERMSTKARFEKEAKGNSEMAYCGLEVYDVYPVCDRLTSNLLGTVLGEHRSSVVLHRPSLGQCYQDFGPNSFSATLAVVE